MPAAAGTDSAASEPFSARVAADGDGVRIALAGDFDIAAIPRAEQAFVDALQLHPAAIAIDLSRLTFIDSSGLQFVVGARVRCAAAGARYSLVPGDRRIQRIFALTGLDAELPFEQPE